MIKTYQLCTWNEDVLRGGEATDKVTRVGLRILAQDDRNYLFALHPLKVKPENPKEVRKREAEAKTLRIMLTLLICSPLWGSGKGEE